MLVTNLTGGYRTLSAVALFQGPGSRLRWFGNWDGLRANLGGGGFFLLLLLLDCVNIFFD